MQIKIPKDVQYILDKLSVNNYEAYIVGGCVRDSILNRKPKDWDICTDARPEKILELFEKTVPTGLKHGTVTVIVNNVGYEVTTFRIDGQYNDGRHPEKVAFTSSIIEDLSRRDLTINAMAYNSEKGLIDPFDGIRDIENKIIRTVGRPHDRFTEDALRMLRAIRFTAQLNFNLDKETRKSIGELNDNLRFISIERIRSEFEKIIISNPFKINTLAALGLLKYIVPELYDCINFKQDNPYHCLDVYNHILTSVEFIDEKPHLRLTMLLHDICKPQCKTTDENGIGHFYGHAELSSDRAVEVLKRLKYDNKTIEKVRVLVKYHDRQIGKKKSIRKLLNQIGEDNLRDLLKVKCADILSQNREYLEGRLEELTVIEEKLQEILEQKECFSIKDLDINGRDLIDLGILEGKEIGDYLNYCLEKVLEDPRLNNKNDLIKLCSNKIY